MGERPDSPDMGFLRELERDLIEALRKAENQGWHHEARSSERFQTYLRIGTWCSNVQRYINNLVAAQED